MEVVIVPDYAAMSRVAADKIEAQLKAKPNSILGLATGSSPVGCYEELVRRYRAGRLDFSKVVTFNLDEYVGLPSTHEQSYHYFMRKHLFDHVDIPAHHINIPSGTAHDYDVYSAWYEGEIAQYGGIDLQLLGIGSDGHIAFNEPGSSLGSRTRLKTLMKSTIKDNARFFGSEEAVPHFAVTMGVGTIMEAKEILLVASGESKAEAVAQFIEGPVTSQITASALQLHRQVTVVVDEAAASELENADYYRWVYEQKERASEIARHAFTS
jgi:glucosamine-6-phosphate deaminase